MLGVAIVLETLSFRTAIIETNKVRGDASYAAFVRHAKKPELPVILLEDLAALLGLVFALLAVTLSLITDNYYFDVAGTAMIGVLLVVVAVVLAIETKSLLLGEAASLDAQDRIITALESIPGIDRIIHMKTLHLGPDELLVGAKIAVDATATAAQVAIVIDASRTGRPGRGAVGHGDLPRAGHLPGRRTHLRSAVNTFLAVLGVLLVITDYVIKILAIGVLPSNRKPSSAMAWLILILIIPFAGFIVFLFLGRTNVGAKRLARQREAEAAVRAATDRLPVAPVAGPVYLGSDGHPQPEARLAAAPGRQPRRADPGLRRRDRAMTEAVEAAAVSTVEVEFYIAAWDDVTTPVLRRAGRRGRIAA